MKIYTNEKEKKNVLCEMKSWEEVLFAGWKLEAITKNGIAIMTRDGYINEFWQEDV